MAARLLEARVDHFAGLSDRVGPAKLAMLARIPRVADRMGTSCPDLLNVDFFEGNQYRRNGYERKHTNVLRNASVHLNGISNYLRIPYISQYNPTGKTLYFALGVTLWSIPTVTTTVWTCGFGTAGGLQACLRINPTGGVGGVLRWEFLVFDVGVTRTYTLDEAFPAPFPTGQQRFFEWYMPGGLNTPVEFSMYNANKERTVSPVTTPISNIFHILDDYFLGVSTIAHKTPGTDFVNASLYELRIKYYTTPSQVTNLAVGASDRFKRELTPDETALCDGYWRFNDGTDSGFLRDFSANINHATAPNSSAAYVFDQNEVLGKSGIGFNGGVGWIHLKDNTVGGVIVNDIFGTTSTFAPRWTVRGIFVPKLDVSDGVIARNQVIFWFGHNAGATSRPQPVGLRVVGNRFEASFDDGGTTVPLTLNLAGDPTVGSLANKRVRFAVIRQGSGNGVFQLQISWFPGATTDPTTLITRTITVGCTAAAPGVISPNCAIARHATSFIQQPTGTFGTFFTDGSCFGVQDDFQIVRNYGASGAIGVGLYANNVFNEVSDWSFVNAGHATKAYLRMNEGGGSQPIVEGEGWTARIHPPENTGYNWDRGFVDPYVPVEAGGLFEFDLALSDGKIVRQLLAISGSTLYKIDQVNRVAIPVAAGLYQGGLWTWAKYGNTLYLAAANGKRPMKWNGGTLDWVGIAPPLVPPQVTTNAAGGSFVAGIYQVYYTYRNSLTAVESNPSPPFQITVAGATSRIDVTDLSTSPDPQVNQRRIYVSLIGGVNGSAAFLATNGTIDDNITTSWTTDITSAPTGGVALVFNSRAEAPQGSIVAVYKDYLFVGGEQTNPTRAYFSAVGAPDYFDPAIRYIDLNSNTGDPIVGMFPQINRLVISVRDGFASVFLTGDVNDPVRFDYLSIEHGPTGPHAAVSFNDEFFYISEHDIWYSDLNGEENISTPLNPLIPAIQTEVRDNMLQSRKDRAVTGRHKAKNQIWFSYTHVGQIRNSHIVVFDRTQRIWTKYALPTDVSRKWKTNSMLRGYTVS